MDCIEDLQIFERFYSKVRTWAKWRSFLIRDDQGIGEYLNAGWVQVRRGQDIELFSVSCLAKRLKLRESEEVKNKIKELWSLANPYKRSGILSGTYEKLLECVYEHFFENKMTKEEIGNCVKIDSALDLVCKNYVSFDEFYKIFFNVVDSLTISKFQNEYIKVLEDIKSLLLSSPLINYPRLIRRKHSPLPSGNMITEVLCTSSHTHSKLSPGENEDFTSNKKFLNWDLNKMLASRRSVINRELSPLAQCCRLKSSKKPYFKKKKDFLSKNPISKTPLRDRRDLLKSKTPDILNFPQVHSPFAISVLPKASFPTISHA